MTDYAETVISAGKLDFGESNSKVFLVRYHEDDDTPRPKASPHEVKINLTGLVPTSELLRYLSSRLDDPSDFESRKVAIQAFDIIFAGTQIRM